MKEKMKRLGRRHGFTLVELVIVIAILAILAAIAIPVINTTINSAKMSTLESDTATLDLLLKTAVTEMENSVKPTVYHGSVVGVSTKIEDVLYENNLGSIPLTRRIAGSTYYMVWNHGGLDISLDSTNQISYSTTLGWLATV